MLQGCDLLNNHKERDKHTQLTSDDHNPYDRPGPWMLPQQHMEYMKNMSVTSKINQWKNVEKNIKINVAI